MEFKNVYEARKWFLNYNEFIEDIISFCYKYDSSNWEFGDFILFQHIINGQKISRPILGIFTSFTVWDMALVLNFVQKRRAWTYSHEVITNPDINYKMLVGHLDDEIETIQFWTDNIKVLGHWKSKPSIKQLKEGLNEKTK